MSGTEIAYWSIHPKTIYDETHSWVNANDRVAYERALTQGTPEERKMATALTTADPGTSNAMIANNMTNWRIPPRFGYSPDEPGIMEVIELTGNENFGVSRDMPPTDFSGQPQSAGKATSYPSMPVF